MRFRGVAAPNPARQGTRADLRSPVFRMALLYALCWVPYAFADLDDIRFRVAADANYEDNVSRARKGDKLDDSFATLNLDASVPLSLSTKSRLVVGANWGAEGFRRFTGLNRYYAKFQAELQFRNSGQFGEPIWALFALQGRDWYESDLRDGYRTSAGLSVRKPLTDRLFLYSALAYNQRDGRNTVFHTKEVSLRATIDYSLARHQTLYFGVEGRDGDIVSTARPNPAYLDIADAVVRDDVFTDTPRSSYRIRAYTGVASVGYNLAVNEHAALDVAYRVAYSCPHNRASTTLTTDRIDYVDNQLTLSLLVRF